MGNSRLSYIRVSVRVRIRVKRVEHSETEAVQLDRIF